MNTNRHLFTLAQKFVLKTKHYIPVLYVSPSYWQQSLKRKQVISVRVFRHCHTNHCSSDHSHICIHAVTLPDNNMLWKQATFRVSLLKPEMFNLGQLSCINAIQTEVFQKYSNITQKQTHWVAYAGIQCSTASWSPSHAQRLN